MDFGFADIVLDLTSWNLFVQSVAAILLCWHFALLCCRRCKLSSRDHTLRCTLSTVLLVPLLQCTLRRTLATVLTLGTLVTVNLSYTCYSRYSAPLVPLAPLVQPDTLYTSYSADLWSWCDTLLVHFCTPLDSIRVYNHSALHGVHNPTQCTGLHCVQQTHFIHQSHQILHWTLCSLHRSQCSTQLVDMRWLWVAWE